MSEHFDALNKGTDVERSRTSMSGVEEAPSLALTMRHPDDVLNHSEMTKAEKRAVLASWASDARAVENAPALRQLDSGAIVSIDDILEAMKALDAAEDVPAKAMRIPGCRVSFARQDKNLVSWFRSKAARRNGRDDDDDPPPCPASAALPVRLWKISAHAAEPKRMPMQA